MKFGLDIYHRRSIRLKDYDYSQPGAYSITIATHQRRLLFGHIIDGTMSPNQCGQIVQACWEDIPRHFANARVDTFVVMPNHVHGVIFIVGARHAVPLRAEAFARPVPGSLPTIIRSFKSTATKRINEIRGTPEAPVWHRNYYEHVVRSEGELNQIREYIENNPARWALDRENPDNW